MVDSPPADGARLRRLVRGEQHRLAHALRADWRGLRAFSLAQRRALAALLALFLACLVVGLLRNPTHLDDPLPAGAARYDELVDRLDPNVAGVVEFAALPNLGERRARDLVEHRERLRRGDPTRVVFRTVDDLMAVRGIGFAISRQLEPFLAFPATTRPALDAAKPSPMRE